MEAGAGKRLPWGRRFAAGVAGSGGRRKSRVAHSSPRRAPRAWRSRAPTWIGRRTSPPEFTVTFRCICAQSPADPEGTPQERLGQRFPTPPKRFLCDGRLREPRPKWDGKEGLWQFIFRKGTDSVTLTAVDLDKCAAAQQEITKVSLTLGLPHGGPSRR